MPYTECCMSAEERDYVPVGTTKAGEDTDEIFVTAPAVDVDGSLQVQKFCTFGKEMLQRSLEVRHTSTVSGHTGQDADMRT